MDYEYVTLFAADYTNPSDSVSAVPIFKLPYQNNVRAIISTGDTLEPLRLVEGGNIADGVYNDRDIYYTYGFHDFEPYTSYIGIEENIELENFGKWLFYQCGWLSKLVSINRPLGSDISYMFSGCSNLTDVNVLGEIDLSHITDARYLFHECRDLVSVPDLNLSNCEWFISMFDAGFDEPSPLQTIGVIDMSGTNYDTAYNGCTDMFLGCRNLRNVGGLTNLSVDISFADCPLLTKESVLNIFNSIATIYNEEKAPTMTLHEDTYNLLNADEIAIATNKGWIIHVDYNDVEYDHIFTASYFDSGANYDEDSVGDLYNIIRLNSNNPNNLHSTCSITGSDDINVLGLKDAEAWWDTYTVDDSLWDTSADYNVYLEKCNWNEYELGYFMFGDTNLNELIYIADGLVSTFCMFQNCNYLIKVDCLEGKMSNVTDATEMFTNCTGIQEIPALNLSQCTTFGSMFWNCHNIHTIGVIDMSGTNYDTAYNGCLNMFSGCRNLINVGGLTNLSVNISFEDCPLLTKESVLNIFYSIATIYNEEKTPTMTLHQDTYNLLYADEIAIATNKGWIIHVDYNDSEAPGVDNDGWE